MRRPGRRPLLVALIAALLGMAAAGVPVAGGAAVDKWSGRWEVTFTSSGNGQQRTTGPLCCVDVQPITKEQGLALARGQTGDVRNNPLTDVVCGAEIAADSRLFFQATAPFEFVSGHQGVVPGPDVPTMGAAPSSARTTTTARSAGTTPTTRRRSTR